MASATKITQKVSAFLCVGNVYVAECFADFDRWYVHGVVLSEVQATEPAGDACNRLTKKVDLSLKE